MIIGCQGYNELTFEDKSGQEQIITHAQKDYNETVENDHATVVNHDQINTVDNDHTNDIGHIHTETVGDCQNLTVQKDDDSPY